MRRSATATSRATRIPKPTVTRLVATLASLGYLRETSEERYALGAGVMTLARAFLAGLDIRAAARPRMAALAEELGATVYLAIGDPPDMVVIEACRSRSTVLSSRLEVGSRIPLAVSALGRAYLSGLDAGEREALIGRFRAGGGWRNDGPGVEAALRDAAAHGYCLSLGEWHPDVSAAAVPLRAPSGDMLALNCGGPAFRFTEAHLRRRVAPRLLAAARSIAAEIGGADRAPLRAVSGG